MALTQESILSLLLAAGGEVKKCDLVAEFKARLDCDDAAEKERNRERFKTCVNAVAFVREVDGVRYVVVKKAYKHLLRGGVRAAEKSDGKEKSEDGEEAPPPRPPPPGEQQRLPAQGARTESRDDVGEQRSAASEPDRGQARGERADDPQRSLSPLLQALQRSKGADFIAKRMQHFESQTQGTNAMGLYPKEPARVQSKPYALPLRMPPSQVEVCRATVDPGERPESPTPDTFRSKGGPPSAEAEGVVGSPLMRGAVKSTGASEESKETRVPSSVPLEQSEHEWLVKCATGHWSQVYGLLLRDKQLAEKRDFMSGFTALHWAAKCGNSRMLEKIIDQARQGGVDVDINAKAHGGYTPLHIAALHDQEYIMAMLVGEYGADWSIRDNCGKRAYHYLHKGISGTVREMLGEPKAQQIRDRTVQEKEGLDVVPDLSRGLHSLGRLFQPHGSGYRKKHKRRPGFYSLSNDPNEEREDRGGGGGGGSFRPRILSEAFM